MRTMTTSGIALVSAAALALAGTAEAKKPAEAGAPAASEKTAKPAKPAKPGKCTPRAVGFNATGTLVAQALTQSAGADTPARDDDRYSGTVTVKITKANHKAPTGEQVYTLENDRVNFADADEDNVADTPKAGDRVKVQGKITRLAKKCDASAFTPTTDVRKVSFKAAKAPKSEATETEAPKTEAREVEAPES